MSHVIDKCYKLHGYSLGYKYKNNEGQVATSSTSFASNVVATEDNACEAVNLTRAEYQQLLGLLNS